MPRAATPERRTAAPVTPLRSEAPSRGGLGLLWAAIAGGVIGAVIVILLLATGIVPLGGSDAGADEAHALASQVAGFQARLDALSPAVDKLDAQVTDLTSQATATSARLDKLETAAPPSPAAPGGANAGDVAAMRTTLDQLTQRVAALEASATASGGNAAAIAALGDRTAALEASVKDLGAKLDSLAAHPPTTDSIKAARAIAIALLRQAAARGGSFASDLAPLETLGSDPADVASLKPLAAKGAPSAAELASEFPAIGDAIVAATTGNDTGSGFLDRVGGFARGLVTVRPTGPIPGDDPAAIVSRMQADIDADALAKALAERQALPPEGLAASAAWAAGATDRIAIDALVDKLVQSTATSNAG